MRGSRKHVTAKRSVAVVIVVYPNALDATLVKAQM